MLITHYNTDTIATNKKGSIVWARPVMVLLGIRENIHPVFFEPPFTTPNSKQK